MLVVKASAKIRLVEPADAVLAYIQNIQNLGHYEPKVSRLRILAQGPTNGEYRASGRLMGLPWAATFAYRLTENGFYSAMAKPVNGVEVSGGFSVFESDEQGCLLTHWEHYELNARALPLYCYLKARLAALLRQELEAIRLDLGQPAGLLDVPVV